jgi:hypothetical protein
VLRTDSLATKSARANSLDVAPELRGDTAEFVDDDIYDVVPVEAEKRGAYREVKQDATFDLVIGNPPYVAEANNKPLFDHFRKIPAWRGIYRGKTDYLYYFLWLAVDKLKPGGKLCVILPAGWMNAGNADFLRERLASKLTLEELYLFGSYKLFAADQGPAATPTVESAILVATKAPAPKRHKLRVVALEDESAVAGMTRAELLTEMARRRGGRSGRRGVSTHTPSHSPTSDPSIRGRSNLGSETLPGRLFASWQLDSTIHLLPSSRLGRLGRWSGELRVPRTRTPNALIGV